MSINNSNHWVLCRCLSKKNYQYSYPQSIQISSPGLIFLEAIKKALSLPTNLIDAFRVSPSMRGSFFCFRLFSFYLLQKQSGSHLTISLALEAGDLLITQYLSLRQTILSSMRKGSVKLYFSGMMAPQYYRMYSPWNIGLVANSPLPAPSTADYFISSLYSYESPKISGSSGSSRVGSMPILVIYIVALNHPWPHYYYILIIAMDKLKKLIQTPLELTLAISGLGLLGLYAFYARSILFGQQKKKAEKSSLELNLKDLIKHRNDKNICKIVITESEGNRLPFKGNLVTRLKQLLLGQQQHILVNCSPLKLFNAGVEIFGSTLSKQDPDDEHEFFSYFRNALQCELLIERTVTDIEQIKNKTKRSYLICDTNSMDLKVQSDEDLWTKFLVHQQINEEQLKCNYEVVFHVLSADYTISPKMGGTRKKSINNSSEIKKTDDEKIKHAWAGFNNYYQICYDPELSMEQNVEISLQKMMECLKPYLPETVTYRRPEPEKNSQ